MMDTMQVIDKDHFLTQFDRLESKLSGNRQAWVRDLRKQAFARFEELGFPTARAEDWRFTNVSGIAKHAFQSVIGSDVFLNGDVLEREDIGLEPGIHTVFVNGHFAD